MIKLKKIKLKNYCGYRDFKLDLTDGDGVKKWIMLYGPNGTGKSNFIQAMGMLATPARTFTERKNILPMRKLKYHHDYIYGVEVMYDDVNELTMEATFITRDNKEKKVIIEDNIKGVIFAGRTVDEEKGEISGIKTNELSLSEEGFVFVDADNKNMTWKFQIISELIEPFCDFASAVYGLKCYCPDNRVLDSGLEFCTDFVIEKKNGTKVHYKRFSDGEKKIATLLSSLFKRAYKDSPSKENIDILMIDNIELHIYFKRHMKLIEKMEEYFPDKQIIATTHSPIIINEMDKKYLIDME